MENYGSSAGASGTGDADSERSTGRGRGRRIAEQEPLRRPHQPPASSSGNSSEIVKNSVLSADAAEFVPKSFSGPSSRSSGVQDRIQIAREASNVQHVVLQREQQSHHQYNSWQHSEPSQSFQQQHQQQQFPDMRYNMPSYQYNQYPVIQDYGQFDGGSGDYADRQFDNVKPGDLRSCILQLETAIRTLTSNPGKFDSLISPLVSAVKGFLDQQDQCEEIFNLIIQQSINEENFRYSGARLCTHLDAAVLAPDRATSLFRDTLIKICKQKSEAQAETWRQITKHTNQLERDCHGLIFFLAELVTQMDSKIASDLGKVLIQLINIVLQNPGPNSAKKICQTLKLAGQTLEKENSGNKAEMEQVMRTLSELVIQGGANGDVSLSRMVSNVSDLRSKNWGAVAPPPSVERTRTTWSYSSPAPPTENQTEAFVADETVFYGPDGEIITEEQSRFLEDFAAGELANSQEPWEINDDDDYDDALDAFVQMSQNNNKANKKNDQTRNSNEH